MELPREGDTTPEGNPDRGAPLTPHQRRLRTASRRLGLTVEETSEYYELKLWDRQRRLSQRDRAGRARMRLLGLAGFLVGFHFYLLAEAIIR